MIRTQLYHCCCCKLLSHCFIFAEISTLGRRKRRKCSSATTSEATGVWLRRNNARVYISLMGNITPGMNTDRIKTTAQEAPVRLIYVRLFFFMNLFNLVFVIAAFFGFSTIFMKKNWLNVLQTQKDLKPECTYYLTFHYMLRNKDMHELSVTAKYTYGDPQTRVIFLANKWGGMPVLSTLVYTSCLTSVFVII